MASTGSYALITPARNEAATIGRTIDAIVSQSLLPSHWIIVDDGSSDETVRIVREAANRHPFITVARRPDRGRDIVGAGVVQALHEGLTVLGAAIENLTYLGKVDADISVAPDYFERLCGCMDREPRLAIASGQSCLPQPDGSVHKEVFSTFHPLGAARLWRTDVFREIGGLVPSAGWDTLDIIRARLLGYETRMFEDLQVLHFRPMGSRGELREGVTRLGRIAYLLGYHPLYFLARVLLYAFQRPFLFRARWLASGYHAAWRRHEPLIVTPAERRWLRAFQLRRLLRRN